MQALITFYGTPKTPPSRVSELERNFFHNHNPTPSQQRWNDVKVQILKISKNFLAAFVH